MFPDSSEGARCSDRILAYLSAARSCKERSQARGVTSSAVLVVDDEETLANTTAEILNAAGFCAFVAYDGKTALDLSARLNPDILLTDVLMPAMNGVELAMSILAELPRTSVVMFSGQAGTIDVLAKAQAEGHWFELLPKPIHPLKLIEHLRKLPRK